jgi:hypothetical protein
MGGMVLVGQRGEMGVVFSDGTRTLDGLWPAIARIGLVSLCARPYPENEGIVRLSQPDSMARQTDTSRTLNVDILPHSMRRRVGA